jgi:tetratricopeptide (TPR) repeat protein
LVTGSTAKAGDEYVLADIAMRQAKVRSCKQAQHIFTAATGFNEMWAKEKTDNDWRFDSQIGFLERLVAMQRRVGCLEEMKVTTQRLIALYQQRNQRQLEKSAGDEPATALHNLQLQLDLGELYLSMDDFSAARGVAAKILQQVRAATWRSGLGFERAAVVLARLGHDEEAFEVVNRYDQFREARQESNEDPTVRFYWMSRVTHLAMVAQAQEKAGHREAARATLRQAMEKARRTPVARLTEVYGENARSKPGASLGEGEALQSAGFMSIVWHAASIGETALALEAFEQVSPLANESGATGALIRALAGEGKVAEAQKLHARFPCSSPAIARGLLDRQDWADALHADESYRQSSSSTRECEFFEGGPDYWAGLGQARVFEQGTAEALAWARKQSRDHKVYALLGIVDALVVEREQAGVSSPMKSKADSPAEEKLVDVSAMSVEERADLGEKLIFGAVGKSRIGGAIGKAQCPLCHSFQKGFIGERAPNLYGITNRANERLKDPRYHLGHPNERDTVQQEAFPGSGTATSALEYIAESAVCTHCFVVPGFGTKGTDDRESPEALLLKPPLSLSIDELIAIDTWLYVHDGKNPPSPDEIRRAYRKFIPESEWQMMDRPPR